MTTINLNISINGAAPADLKAPRQPKMAPSHMQPPAPVREFYRCQSTTRRGDACGNVIKHDKWVRGVHFCSHHRGDAAIEELEQLRARVQQLSTDKAALQARADKAEESTRRVLSERDEARRERDEAQDRAAGELARAQGEIKSLTVANASKERERFTLAVAVHATKLNARSEREHWSKEREVLQAQNRKLRETQKRIAGELATLSEDKRLLLARITAADGNTATARSERDQARKSLDGSQTKLADSLKKLANSQAQLAEAREMLDEEVTHNADLETSVDAAEATAEKMRGERDEARQNLADSESKLADSQSKLVSARKTEDELITYSDDLETRINAAEGTTERVSRERDEFRRERDELQRSLSEAQDRAASEVARLSNDNRLLLARVVAADGNTARARSERDEERKARAEVEAQNGELLGALQQADEEITLAQRAVEKHANEYRQTFRSIQDTYRSIQDAIDEALNNCGHDLDDDTC